MGQKCEMIYKHPGEPGSVIAESGKSAWMTETEDTKGSSQANGMSLLFSALTGDLRSEDLNGERGRGIAGWSRDLCGIQLDEYVERVS